MRTWLVVIAVLLAATSALAHHSNSAFDPEKVVVLKGTVTEWKWTNPHVWIFLSVDDGKGGKDGVGDRGPPPRRIGPFRLVEEHLQARRHDHRGFQPGEGRQPHRSHHARHARRWHRAVTGVAGVSNRGGGEDIMSKTIALLSVALVCLLPGSTASIRAQETPAHPDFTGVYFPFNPNAAPAAPRGAGTPPRPVAVIDGRAGRPATAPKLAPEYLAKWEVMRQSRMAGSSETDPNANCLSAGMPGMMSHGLRHGNSADEGQDHHLRRAERRVSPDLSGRPQAVTENARRSDVRRVFRGALGRRHARRRHRGPARGHAARPVLAAQRSAHRARAHQIYVAWRPRGSGSRQRIRRRCSNPSPRFVRIGKHRRRTTSCASSRVRRAFRRSSRAILSARGFLHGDLTVPVVVLDARALVRFHDELAAGVIGRERLVVPIVLR